MGQTSENGNTPVWTERIALKSLTPWEGNPPLRARDSARYHALRKSMQEHGQLVPVQVLRCPGPDRPLLIIWDGCRRYRAAQELGWSTLLCCVRPGVPEDIPRLALQANLNAERWTNAEVTQVVQEFGLERVAPYLSKQTVTKLRGLLSALSEQEFQQYCAMGLGVRGYEEAKRFARVFGWPDEDEEVGKVIRWVMLGGGRSFRSLQLMLEMGAPPRRIAELVSAGKSPRDIF